MVDKLEYIVLGMIIGFLISDLIEYIKLKIEYEKNKNSHDENWKICEKIMIKRKVNKCLVIIVIDLKYLSYF